MKTIGNVIKMFILITVALYLFAFYIIPYRVLIKGPFTIDEMDIDKNDFLSPEEAGYFADYGKKEIAENGKICIEYYAYKDGRELKKLCE